MFFAIPGVLRECCLPTVLVACRPGWHRHGPGLESAGGDGIEVEDPDGNQIYLISYQHQASQTLQPES
jgi:hypothetical protein